MSELQEPSVMRSNASCESIQKSVFSDLPGAEPKELPQKEQIKLPPGPQKVVCELALRGGKYTGETVNKQPHGKGRMELANGSVYEGDFYWGAMHGTGDFQMPSGDHYQGELHQNNVHGEGKMTYVNGDVYEGHWRYGER